MEKGEIIGKGRTAEVIFWGNNKVLKLFYRDFSSESIDYQYKVDLLVGKIFPNCPKVFDKIEERSRIGIIYEYIEGKELREIMGRKIKTVGKALRMLAEVHSDLHKFEVADIHTQKEAFSIAIQKTDLLDKNQKKKILAYLEKLSDGNKICHGDFHPENVLVSNGKFYVMDWGITYSGNPIGDVARTFYILKYGLAPSDEYTLRKSIIHRFFFKRIKSLIANTYLKRYKELTGISLKEIKKWDLIIFAARLRDPVPLEYDFLLEMIKKKIKSL
ncbi:MAG: aminoglycoside phosphotransferase family protein [Promethearchaeota archaeon]